MSTITIISTHKIEVIRDLAYSDRTPDLAGAGTNVIGSGDLMRVNVLKPFSYKFNAGTNVVQDPLTFVDPVTRKEVTESILTWPTVKKLIDKGVFQAYGLEQKIDVHAKKAEPERDIPAKKTTKKPKVDLNVLAEKSKN